jgi:hypothetical protein
MTLPSVPSPFFTRAEPPARPSQRLTPCRLSFITQSGIRPERLVPIPTIDPLRHELVITAWSSGRGLHHEDSALPPVTRTYFIECSGSSRSSYRDPKRTGAAEGRGLTGNTEWTSVTLAHCFARSA